MIRVYEVFQYNLKQLKFKENKEFFEGLLRNLGFSYADIAFTFTCGPCAKVDKAFPELRKYKQYYERDYHHDDIYSSVFVDENDNASLYIDGAHHASFGALLQKIPNPINFGFMGVMLDNVNWYGGETQNAVFSKPKRSIMGDDSFHSYFSNSIRYIKQFDYGNKLNLVRIYYRSHGGCEWLETLSRTF